MEIKMVTQSIQTHHFESDDSTGGNSVGSCTKNEFFWSVHALVVHSKLQGRSTLCCAQPSSFFSPSRCFLLSFVLLNFKQCIILWYKHSWQRECCFTKYINLFESYRILPMIIINTTCSLVCISVQSLFAPIINKSWEKKSKHCMWWQHGIDGGTRSRESKKRGIVH